MGFLHSAFTENTPEMREWLEELGYEYLVVDERDKTIHTRCIKGNWFYCTTDLINTFPRGLINCCSNPDLFKAVAAIRDDNDRFQWFIFDKDVYDMVDEFETGDTLLFKKGEWYLCKDYQMSSKHNHKATLEELIKHFKKANEEKVQTTTKDEETV